MQGPSDDYLIHGVLPFHDSARQTKMSRLLDEADDEYDYQICPECDGEDGEHEPDCTWFEEDEYEEDEE